MKRQKWIDITKGIGIILVILGHLLPYLSNTSKWIFSFHMPLFFFCSGILHKQAKSFKTYIAAKIKSLIFPFIIFCILGSFFTYILYPQDLSIESFKYYMYKGQPELFHVGQIWFLLCLFWVSLVSFPIIKYIKDLRLKLILLFIILVIARLLPNFIKLIGIRNLPLKIDVAVIALFFYLFGNIYSNLASKTNNNSLNVRYGIFLLAFSFGAVFNNLHFNICSLMYEDLLYFLLFSLSAIFSITILSKKIASNSLLEFIGRNSLIIFSTHSFGINLYEILMKDLFHREIYAMNNMTIYDITICTIFTLLLTSLLVTIYSKLKEVVTRKYICK